jgi:hypothetical protein
LKYYHKTEGIHEVCSQRLREALELVFPPRSEVDSMGRNRSIVPRQIALDNYSNINKEEKAYGKSLARADDSE